LKTTHQKKLISLLLLLVVCACARHHSLLDHPKEGLSIAREEWGIHNANVEWWYLTGSLQDDSGRLFFFQFTIFHGIRHHFRGHSTHLAITDLNNQTHYFIEEKRAPSGQLKSLQPYLVADNHSSLRLDGDRIWLQTQLDSIGMKLQFTINTSEVWHGSEGIISMGDPADEKQNSYYFSFPDLSVTGEIFIPGIEEPVVITSGEAWFDKQWGNFRDAPWHWFSLRLDNGDRIMLFDFPESGYQTGTYTSGDSSRLIKGFELSTDSLRDPCNRLPSSWFIRLPESGQSFLLEPAIPVPCNRMRSGKEYWEGLCKLNNLNGRQIGWGVAELAK
jgi:predicted secreted hydrolase